jgi:hypothetical protein
MVGGDDGMTIMEFLLRYFSFLDFLFHSFLLSLVLWHHQLDWWKRWIWITGYHSALQD